MQAKAPENQDLFAPSPSAPAAIREEFTTVAQAHAWIDRNGWLPRHGGGYERAGSGVGKLFGEKSKNSDATVLVFEAP
jgi:hypothetical protein